MYNKLEIEHFRGIKKASIDGFKQVNLFFGRNNCGKSSLLDAIFLISGPSNTFIPVQINTMRGYSKIAKDDLKIDFYDMDTDVPIRIKIANDHTRELFVSLIQETNNEIVPDSQNNSFLSSIEDKKFGLKLAFSTDGTPYQSHFIINSISEDNKVNATISPSDFKESLRCIYLGPKYDFHASIQGLQNILKNKDEHFIIEGLQIIEPKVKDFIFTGEELFVDTGLSRRIPINVMGDGARKIVSLLTAIYDSKDGILLIDELSNGFHHSVMTDLWKVLINAAGKNNTQMFVTTHDLDSIKGLRTASKDMSVEELVSAYKLQRMADGTLKSYLYTIDSIDYSLNQEIEIR